MFVSDIEWKKHRNMEYSGKAFRYWEAMTGC